MKKLLLGASIVLGAIFSANAQTIYFQNFEGQSMPAGWTQQHAAYDPTNLGWKVANAFPGALASNVAAHTYYAFVDDYDNNGNHVGPWQKNWDSLFTPSMNCTAYSHVFISMDLMFAIAAGNGNETASLVVSNNGGATYTTVIAQLPTAGYGWQDSLLVDISAYAANKASVKVGWAYYDAAVSFAGLGIAVDNVDVYAPANYNVQVESQTAPTLMQVGTPYTFSGNSVNFGGDQITAMQMNYSVNGGTPKIQTISGIASFTSLTSYGWTMPGVPFTPPSPGNYTIKFWASPLNSNPNTNTDTLVVNFIAITTVATKVPLYEEFTGQSCVFCMLAAPNMDSVYSQDAPISSIVRYHVPIPARDFMYVANTTPVQARQSYYSVNSAPDGFLDGTYLNPSMYQNPPENTVYSSTTLQAEATQGSALSINITAAKFIAKKDSFFVSASISAYTPLAAGLVAQIALNVDSITYKYDLSMDDPRQSFAPPIGTSAAGFSYTGAPDYLYPYVMQYKEVTEQMFPANGAGTTLGAFTVGNPQTISFGWKKNHPWGLYDKPVAQRDSDFYDSSKTCHFVVWVQTPSAIPTLSYPAKYVLQSATSGTVTMLGVDEVSIGDGVSFAMYPNPANNNTNLAFKLDNDQNVNIQVYNMLGQNVYTANEGTMQAGQHTISINSTSLQAGVYIVRFSTDNASTTQRLIIQK